MSARDLQHGVSGRDRHVDRSSVRTDSSRSRASSSREAGMATPGPHTQENRDDTNRPEKSDRGSTPSMAGGASPRGSSDQQHPDAKLATQWPGYAIVLRGPAGGGVSSGAWSKMASAAGRLLVHVWRRARPTKRTCEAERHRPHQDGREPEPEPRRALSRIATRGERERRRPDRLCGVCFFGAGLPRPAARSEDDFTGAAHYQHAATV